jgi:hypothetical protein
VFWSKIWFFLVAVAAVVALSIALAMPGPAHRTAVTEETRRLVVACGLINIKLEGDAQLRVHLTNRFAHDQKLAAELEKASAAPAIDENRMKAARTIGETVLQGIKGKREPPEFAILIDKKGRVVARVNLEKDEFGDVLAGRPLVDDALAGYLRDDIWNFGRSTYMVAAAPVIKGTDYVGAVVLGHKFSTEFAKRLVGTSLLVELGFYFGPDTIAATDTVALDQKPMIDAVALLKGPELRTDCANSDVNNVLTLRAGSDSYSALVARLPGEAGARGAFYSVFAKKAPDIGFGSTLAEIRKGDLGFASFPWFLVGGIFIVILGGGIFLMLFEADRPLKRLAAETLRLAKGDVERLGEDQHPGKFGSIARSVNIHIDKLGREAKSAKKDLDQLLGPAPEGSLGGAGTIDLLATALPAIRPGGPAPAVPPPPSEFKFGDSGPMQARPPAPPARAATPPPVKPPQKTPAAGIEMAKPAHTDLLAGLDSLGGTPGPAIGSPSSAPLTLDDDILGSGASSAKLPTPPPPSPEASTPRVDPYFKQVYDQFIAVKKSCNEPTAGLTYEKFSEKLVKNRDDLIAKTGCREVRFTVYIKEGKAALKATPVKEEG